MEYVDCSQLSFLFPPESFRSLSPRVPSLAPQPEELVPGVDSDYEDVNGDDSTSHFQTNSQPESILGTPLPLPPLKSPSSLAQTSPDAFQQRPFDLAEPLKRPWATSVKLSPHQRGKGRSCSRHSLNTGKEKRLNINRNDRTFRLPVVPPMSSSPSLSSFLTCTRNSLRSRKRKRFESADDEDESQHVSKNRKVILPSLVPNVDEGDAADVLEEVRGLLSGVNMGDELQSLSPAFAIPTGAQVAGRGVQGRGRGRGRGGRGGLGRGGISGRVEELMKENQKLKEEFARLLRENQQLKASASKQSGSMAQGQGMMQGSGKMIRSDEESSVDEENEDETEFEANQFEWEGTELFRRRPGSDVQSSQEETGLVVEVPDGDTCLASPIAVADGSHQILDPESAAGEEKRVFNEEFKTLLIDSKDEEMSDADADGNQDSDGDYDGSQDVDEDCHEVRTRMCTRSVTRAAAGAIGQRNLESRSTELPPAFERRPDSEKPRRESISSLGIERRTSLSVSHPRASTDVDAPISISAEVSDLPVSQVHHVIPPEMEMKGEGLSSLNEEAEARYLKAMQYIALLPPAHEDRLEYPLWVLMKEGLTRDAIESKMGGDKRTPLCRFYAKRFARQVDYEQLRPVGDMDSPFFDLGDAKIVVGPSKFVIGRKGRWRRRPLKKNKALLYCSVLWHCRIATRLKFWGIGIKACEPEPRQRRGQQRSRGGTEPRDGEPPNE